MEELERIVLKDAEFSGSVLTSLKKVRNGDRLEDIGICWNTCRFYKNPYQDVCWAYLKSLFPYWEFFSGDRSYPVPHPNTLPDSGFYRGVVCTIQTQSMEL